MADPNTIYKMTMLAMLDKIDFPLSNTQISNFFLEQDYTDYFTVQQVIHELLDSELIRFESTHSNTQYHLTSLGRETLKFFEDKVTPAIKADIAAFFERNQMEMKIENSLVADFYKSTFSGYDVRCRLKQKNLSIIDLTIHVETKEQADAVCKNWKKQSDEIYACLMDILIQ